MDSPLIDSFPPDTNDTSSRRRGLARGIAILAAVAWMMSAASPASADEFVIGIVVESSASDSDISAFMEGFQVAVDQSPDVSHPPGEEGGDHLGSMDVSMIIVGGELQRDELLRAATELVEIDRVPIIVVDATSELLGPLVDVANASGTMLIVLSDGRGGGLLSSALVFDATDQEATERLLSDRALPFEDVFSTRYGQPPSPTATRGYIAGRLVDISVEATDRDPFDASTLAVALTSAIGTQEGSPGTVDAEQAPVESTETVPAEAADTTVPEAQGESAPSDIPSRAGLALIVAIAGVVVIVAWIVRQRLRRPGT